MARNRNRAERAIEPTPAPEAIEPEANATEQTPLEDATTPNRSVVPTRWVKAYAKSTLKGTCDDALAHQLDALTKTDGKADLAKIRALGAINGIDVDSKWGQRNAGMQRMNLGNVLRGRAKRGEEVILA
jgi:hypothetical protein